MKVVLFHREPIEYNQSGEGAFDAIRRAVPKDVECVVAQF